MSGDGSANQDRPDPTGEPDIAPADAVIPPPPPEIPIPDDLLTPPPSESSVPDAVIPPPPPETRRRSADRTRPTPSVLEGEQPAAAADDWAEPSVAPQVPTSGGYRGLTIAIFTFLLLLLVAAVAVLIYLVSSGSFPFVALGAGGLLPVALPLQS